MPNRPRGSILPITVAPLDSIDETSPNYGLESPPKFRRATVIDYQFRAFSSGPGSKQKDRYSKLITTEGDESVSSDATF